MPDEPITGIKGSVKMIAAGGVLAALASVRKFTVNKRADNKKYATSDTGGWKKSAEGNKSFDGSIDVYLNDGVWPTWYAGQSVDFELTSNTGKTATGTARIDSIENLEIDIENSEMLSCTLVIDGDGDIVFAGA